MLLIKAKQSFAALRFCKSSISPQLRSLVGAGLLAMVVNDDACGLVNHGASIASKPVPTGIALSV
jgi:hypothetical protein